ncbi:MAG TPA: SDR family NAD(P)-dependent oxidoreductase [Stellaceae bacterium]|nr:SDR family NAD(P)-dependent oxidoreductase [Stellaceae bacterium]
MVDTARLFRLDGQTALVTGAASGLGQVIAEGYAAAGAEVICADIEAVRLDGVSRGIAEAGGKATALTLDVADEKSVEAAVAPLRQRRQRIDVLVNCAGVAAMPARTHELSIADWHRVIAINLTGTFLMTRAVLPMMLGHEGSIVNLASVLGAGGGYYPGFPSTGLHYAATKAAIVGLTRQLAAEYAADNIRVNAIAPGWLFGTRLGDYRRSKMSDDEQKRFLAEIKARIPMGRTGAPEEILGLALYLAAPASRYVTGQLVAQDGGWTAC